MRRERIQTITLRQLFIGSIIARVWVGGADSHSGPEQVPAPGVRDDVDGGGGENSEVGAWVG